MKLSNNFASVARTAISRYDKMFEVANLPFVGGIAAIFFGMPVRNV